MQQSLVYLTRGASASKEIRNNLLIRLGAECFKKCRRQALLTFKVLLVHKMTRWYAKPDQVQVMDIT